MSADDNKAIYRRYIQEVFNEGRLDAADELLADSYVNHDAPPGTPHGPEGVKAIVTMYRTAFPDLEISFDEQVAEGDTVASRTTFRGTHREAIFGIPATGIEVTMSGLMLDRIVDGRLVESWVKNDVLGMLAQLGAWPPSS